jgi:hypothetical protein
VVSCAREHRADGVHFYIEVGNPYSLTYAFASFNTTLLVGNERVPLHTDITKPSVDIIENLKPGSWARFELRPPGMKTWPLAPSELEYGFLQQMSGLHSVTVTAYTKRVDLRRPMQGTSTEPMAAEAPRPR